MLDEKRDPSASTRKRIDHYSYKLTDRIGKGYSSQVYRGRDDHNSLKVIDLKGLRDAVARQMLDSEISILKQLKNPNILRCIQVLKTSNHCYIITQLCQGGDLATVIKKRGKLTQNQALNHFADIFKGFYQISSNNILHRDLKPANIFLSKGVCKIADFGFAKKNTAPGMRQKYNVGSPLYMSPQSLKRNVYSNKNDIWSMGIILFQMLYGKTPWDCRSQKQLIQKITKVPVSFPQSPKISDEIKQFIKKCLDPQQCSRISLKEMANHPIIKSIDFKTITNSQQNKQIRSTSFLPPVRVLGERNQNNSKGNRDISVDPFSYKASVNLSVTDRQNKTIFQQTNKQNKKKQVMSKQVAIQKINVCRLIFKLKQQLGDQNIISPQLRQQLLIGISQLKRQDHSQRVKKVVDQYFTKYSNSVIGKQQHSVQFMQDKALNMLWGLAPWAKQLLTAYLAMKRGMLDGLGGVLDKARHKSDQQLKLQLRRAGLTA